MADPDGALRHVVVQLVFQHRELSGGLHDLEPTAIHYGDAR
jgi:hypothetical protein